MIERLTQAEWTRKFARMRDRMSWYMVFLILPTILLARSLDKERRIPYSVPSDWKALWYSNLDELQRVNGDYHIGGVNFQWNDGIFGIALSPAPKEGHRTLYFHPLSSTREFAVSTKVLQNKTNADSYHEYKILGSRGPNSQATASSLDEKTGVLVYTQVNKDAIGCWNSVRHADEYSADTNGIIAADNETLIFPNDLKVDKNGNLWVVSDRLPQYIYKQLDYKDVNFRVLTASVAEAIKGTVCDNA